MSTLPEGWTDDMRIPLPSGLRVEDLADLVLSSVAQKEAYEATLDRLAALGLSPDDAALAYDRALGGLVRAATRNAANEPSQVKDPIAHASYVRCLREPSLIGAIRPEWAQPPVRRRWWHRWWRR